MDKASNSLVLVTGATGFVGRHLCSELVKRGFLVRGTYRNRRPDLKEVEWVDIGNIGPETDWTSALTGVTHVIHLAALAHQVGVENEGIHRAFQRINVEGTRGLLKAVASIRLPGRFCHVSSSGVVCAITDDLITEDSSCRPDNIYGQSKLQAEQLVQALLRPSGSHWAIIRPTLVYGPGNPGNMARLLRLIRFGVPLPLGGIRNRRSFVFVGNLVDALIRCLDHPGAEDEILTISDGINVSTPDLVRMIGLVSGQRVRIFRFPMMLLRLLARCGDVPKAIFGRSVGLDSYSLDRLTGSHAVDARRTFEKLRWQPPHTMEEGLALTLSAELNQGKDLS